MKQYRTRILWLLSVLGLIVFISYSYSLTLAKASLKELTEESTLIIVGKVAATECVWLDKSAKVICTDLKIAIDDQLKGEKNTTIAVRQLGGKIDDFGLNIPGTPQFNIGDKAVFFLVKHQGFYWIHSIALGSFKIVTDELGQQFVVNDLQDVNLIDPATNANIDPQTVFNRTPMTAFLKEVKSYITEIE